MKELFFGTSASFLGIPDFRLRTNDSFLGVSGLSLRVKLPSLRAI
jgi:hypothetical protein